MSDSTFDDTHPSMDAMNLSVVIPTYNEEAVIERCLERVLDQPGIDEVIIVDNNSTDRTVEIVTQIAHVDARIRLIREDQQGLIPARNAGFDAAKNNLIARIDADTLVEPGWSSAILESLSSSPESIGAATGPFHPYDLPFQKIEKNLHPVLRRAAHIDKGEVQQTKGVFGANMVITKDGWKRVRGSVNNAPGIWEDSDLSLALREADLKIAYLPEMRAQVSGRRLLSSPRSYWQYAAGSLKTRQLRGTTEGITQARVGTWVRRALYFVHYIPVRAWDPEKNRFSLNNFFSRGPERIIP